MGPEEYAVRLARAAQVRDILGSNRLVQARTGERDRPPGAKSAPVIAQEADAVRPAPGAAQPARKAQGSPQAAFDLLNAPATVAAKRKAPAPGALGKVEELQ